MKIVKLLCAVIASVYFFSYSQHVGQWHYIDSVSLVMHEAGHSVFFFFGNFLYVLGGSLFQVIFPCVFAIYFYMKREYFSGSFILFWVGQNLLNVSLYAADALAMELPLLGGDEGIHDWNNILERLNLLQYTGHISSFIYTLGFIILLIATVLSIKFSLESKNLENRF